MMTDEKLRQEQADEEMINQGFQHLLDSYLTSKHGRKVEIITKAFNFAKQAPLWIYIPNPLQNQAKPKLRLRTLLPCT